MDSDFPPLEPTPPPVKRGRSSVRFGLMTAIGITFFSDAGAAMIVIFLSELLPSQPGARLMALGAAQICFMLLPTLSVHRRQSLPAGELLRLRPAPLILYPAALLGTVSVWIIGQAYQLVQQIYLVPPVVYRFFEKSDADLERMLTARTPVELAVLLLLVGIIPAVSEELLFRGVTQRSLERELRPGRAILYTSLLFATVHLEPLNWVTLLGFSLFLGVLAQRGRSIYPSMLCHFLFNAAAVVAVYIRGDQPFSPPPPTKADLASLIFPTAIAIMILTLVIILLLRLQRPADPYDLPPVGAASGEHPSELERTSESTS